MQGYDEWSIGMLRAEQELVPGLVLKLQRKLVFLTLGAAVEIAPGQFRRISGVVLLTPVETGRARSSWNVSIGQPNGAYPPAGQGGYQATNAETATAAMAGLGVYQTVWITSGLPYIKVLEYGGYPNPPVRGSWDRATRSWVVRSEGGYSRQAPQGMVRITVEGIRAALEAA